MKNNNNVLILISLILINLLLMVSTILADNGSEATSLINYINNGNSNFNLPGMAIGGAETDRATNIKATKQIMASSSRNSPDIKLTLEMPPKPAKIDIVLAMDTSGSMVQHYQQDNETYLDWASRLIPSIVEKYPEARVSIVSWDDEDETGDKMTPFYNVTGDRLAIDHELSTLPQECLETDSTVYSIGVKRAVQVLDNKTNWPADPYNTARIIIFVTGLSEFRSEPKNASNDMTLDYQMENAKHNRTYGTGTNFSGYQIFPVQIGMKDPKNSRWQYNNLSRILDNTRIIGQTVLNNPISIEDINKLDSKINDILNELKSRPVAHDVKVIDTIYPYLDYLGSDNNRNVPVQIKNSSDGSTTLNWNVGTMNGSKIWSATIHTKLNLSLPVEVSLNRSECRYVIANTTPVSEVKYVWMTGYKGNISLPEGRVVLSSGDAINDNTRLTIKAESAERSTPKEQPGFEAYPAVTGILFVTILLGKRKKLRTPPEDLEL